MSGIFKKIIKNYIFDENFFLDKEKQFESVSNIIAEKIENSGRIFFIGIGTSSSISSGLKWDLEYNYSIPNEKIIIVDAGKRFRKYMNDWKEIGSISSAAVFEMQELNLNSNDVLIGISSSAKTEFVMGAIKYSIDIGAKTILLTNTKDKVEIKGLNEIVSFPYDETITNIKSLEATTLLKILLDLIIFGAMCESGRILNGQPIYQKWNSERTKEEIVPLLIKATNKTEQEVIQALNENDWITEYAAVSLITEAKTKEQIINKLSRVKGNFNKLI